MEIIFHPLRCFRFFEPSEPIAFAISFIIGISCRITRGQIYFPFHSFDMRGMWAITEFIFIGIEVDTYNTTAVLNPMFF